MSAVVKDANVLIDLATCKLTDAWFALGVETMTTSFVWNEIERKDHREILERWITKGRFKIVEFESDELSQVLEIHSGLRQSLSIEDASVLHLSVREHAWLLTGDAKLRKCAEKHSIKVAGMLWVLGRLVISQVITEAAAADSLQRLLDEGSRLPQDKCEEQLRRWRKDH